MKRKSAYASMNASDLARITRERGLEKPNVITLSEWADFLEADDAKHRQQLSRVPVDPNPNDGDQDTKDSGTAADLSGGEPPADDNPSATDKPKRSKAKED